MSARYLPAVFGVLLATRLTAANNSIPTAINQLGLDLMRTQTADIAPDGNVLLSPYSIMSVLAMAYVGAEGETHTEMRRVLSLPEDPVDLADGFAGMERALNDLVAASGESVEAVTQGNPPGHSIALTSANQLFAQQDFTFQPAFLDIMRQQFHAPLQTFDFEHEAEQARVAINGWVARQTHDRIAEIVSPGTLGKDTRLVAVNAVYLRARWANAFSVQDTSPEPFWVAGDERTEVPTMIARTTLGYKRLKGGVAVSLPYEGNQLQFVVLLPDRHDGLRALERSLTSATLASCAEMPLREVKLHLPKFKLEPPALLLGESLRHLGLRTVFDVPRQSANFAGIAPPRPDGYLALSEVLHQAWLEVDEEGTEAAAVTAESIVLAPFGSSKKPSPLEVRIDHPFLFAIQHVPSGTCLFLGRVVDPR